MSDALRLRGVSLTLGDFALRDITFTLARGEIFVILGPSGAGKSVLLETIAGFHQPDQGEILIGERDMTHAQPEARRIGLIFQDYALFPHLTVARNVQFACRADPARARGLLSRLGLAHLAERKPANLSGGEKQRVALARALAMDPSVFLFDEPLSAQDARARDTLRDELKSLLRQLGLPAVYVTHDQSEALVLADRLAVMGGGALLQVGTPSEVFNAPANEFVARFVGVETVLEGRTVGAEDGDLRIELGGHEIHAVGETAVARRVLVCIRPENVAISRRKSAESSVRNQFEARVAQVSSLGHVFKITLDCGFPLTAYVTRQSYLELNLEPGALVVAGFKATAIHIITRE
ncbi:MAG: ABC transporter ATP-binding protein [Spirochaetia bacterium]